MPAEDHPPCRPTPKRRVRRWEWAGLAGLGVAITLVLALTTFDQDTDEPDARPVAPAGNPYEAERRAGAQAVLDRWAEAIRTGDTAALPALFDEEADPGFLDAEIARARNAAAVPFSDFGYDIGIDPELPVPGTVADELGASDVWAPTVFLRYGFAGADLRPTHKPVALVLARRGDEWKLVSDVGLPDTGRRTWRGPWDFGPLIVRTAQDDDGRTSVVLGHPEQQEMVDAIAGEIVDSVRHVTDVWGEDWSRRAVVVVAGSRAEFANLVGASHSGTEIAAVAVSDAVDVRSGTASGQRIVFSPEAAERLTDDSRLAILRHELTHVAARTVTEDGSPMWVLEGYADYVGYRGSDSTFAELAPTLAVWVAAGGVPQALPADEEFDAGGEIARRAYESSWSVAAFVASEYGEDRLGELYRALARGEVTDAEVDTRIRDVLGTGAEDLVEAWSGWVAEQVS